MTLFLCQTPFLCRTAAPALSWRSPDEAEAMRHAFVLSLIVLGWHPDTAQALIANADFC